MALRIGLCLIFEQKWIDLLFLDIYILWKMSDQVDKRIERNEQNAMSATAAENYKELENESEGINDEVVIPTSKPKDSLTTSTSNSNENVKKEAPEMNIQLQR